MRAAAPDVFAGGRVIRTPHDAGTPGQGGASLSSSTVIAQSGYSSAIAAAIAPARASISLNVDVVPSRTTVSLTFQ